MRNRTTGLLAAIILAGLGAWAQTRAWDESIAAGQDAMAKGQFAEAEKAFAESLRAAEKIGEKDARYASSLLRLAEACNAQSKREEAEGFARRSGEAMEKSLKAFKPKNSTEELEGLGIAATLFDRVGGVFASHQKYSDAEALYQRAIAIREGIAAEKPRQSNEDWLRLMYQKQSGANTKLAEANEKLAKLYFTERKLPDAAPLFEKAAQIRDSEPNVAKQPLAMTLANLAACYAGFADYTKAEPLYKRAIALFEEADWLERMETAVTMRNYALLLQKTGRAEEAATMMARAEAIRQKVGTNPR